MCVVDHIRVYGARIAHVNFIVIFATEPAIVLRVNLNKNTCITNTFAKANMT
jgi:hypothetical protein